ncbi:hypothetical protein, partial [Paraburkholderia elongata]|uniref:hypothetical protein n=1 Tax=Paraburkholderia elongata TaxID=2675747 RepID=UPI001C12E924
RQAQSPRREAKDVEFPDPATMGAAESANSAQSGYQVNSIGLSPAVQEGCKQKRHASDCVAFFMLALRRVANVRDVKLAV